MGLCHAASGRSQACWDCQFNVSSLPGVIDRALRIGGVILNRVGGARHESKLRAAIAHYTDLPVLGAVTEDPRLAMTERHLGLMPTAEVDDARARVKAIGALVAAQVDLAQVCALAASATPTPIATAAPALAPTGQRDLRIGVARDRAFGFYYPDDLAALEAAGAELIFIDTLHDTRLPALDGLFIGGGFPEACAEAIEANAALRHALREVLAIEAGLPTYAECGGLMALSRSISWRGRRAAMIGAIPGDAVMQARPVGRGYVRLRETASMPWQPAGGTVHGHEFHHSTLVDLDPGLRFAYEVERGHGIDGHHDGIVLHRLLASYAHLRSAAGANWAPRFVDFIRQSRVPAAMPASALAA